MLSLNSRTRGVRELLRFAAGTHVRKEPDKSRVGKSEHAADAKTSALVGQLALDEAIGSVGEFDLVARDCDGSGPRVWPCFCRLVVGTG